MIAKLRAAIVNDRIDDAARLLGTPEGARHVDPGPACSGFPPLAAARSEAMVDLLLQHGADIEKVGEWWQAGFGANDVEAGVGAHLVARGAGVSIHAAAGLGLVDHVREMLDRDPSLVSASGGDGCSPLHFARTAEVAKAFLACGADPDARDDDHRSTPAQWRIRDAPDVVRFLLEAGATADIFMAAGLGDVKLARRLVGEEPECTTHRIGNNRGPFPGIGFEGRGGTIYQWTLGFNQSPHEVARARGHEELYRFLVAHTPPKHLLLVACMLPDRALAEGLVAEHPDLIGELDDEDQALLAKSCWETNRNIDCVRLMLDLGFPVDAPERNHGYTALHNAAWCGDADLVALLLERSHRPDLRDPHFNSTAIGFAVHSCVEARRHPDGDFAGVIKRLLAAGTPLDEGQYPTGDEGIDGVLRKHLGASAPDDPDDDR